jgi:hypothetical protein
VLAQLLNFRGKHCPHQSLEFFENRPERERSPTAQKQLFVFERFLHTVHDPLESIQSARVNWQDTKVSLPQCEREPAVPEKTKRSVQRSLGFFLKFLHVEIVRWNKIRSEWKFIALVSTQFRLSHLNIGFIPNLGQQGR